MTIHSDHTGAHFMPLRHEDPTKRKYTQRGCIIAFPVLEMETRKFMISVRYEITGFHDASLEMS